MISRLDKAIAATTKQLPAGRFAVHAKHEPDAPKVGLFGHFGTLNTGNEATLQAMLFHLRRFLPGSQVCCICTQPEALALTRNIETVPISRTIVRQWDTKNAMLRLLRKLFVGIPSEVYRWFDAFKMLKDCDMFIIPGTGLLTDAFGLREWGPYNLFKWTSMAKLRRCKVLFVSVGAGPINTALGRYLVKSALSLADFRSYRDGASLNYLAGIGFPTNSDHVYPDLALSLPKAMLPGDRPKGGRRSIVGIGLMEYLGKYSMEPLGSANTRPYLKKLVVFGEWLLKHEYDIRLLTGDGGDREVIAEFRCLLKARLGAYDEHRIVDNPVSTVDGLLSELAATDVVITTRFHNVLMALLLNKPVISISFHHKCASLMGGMGLAEYCQDIGRLNSDKLIEQFCELEKNAEKLKPLIRQKTEQCRRTLDAQYDFIFRGIWTV